jgi:hypothetical protein
MEKLIAVEVNALTNEVIERDFTEQEIAEHNAYLLEQESNLQAKEEARTSALAKLAALGLTEEEIAAL